jgi:hypothetical protein
MAEIRECDPAIVVMYGTARARAQESPSHCHLVM